MIWDVHFGFWIRIFFHSGSQGQKSNPVPWKVRIPGFCSKRRRACTRIQRVQRLREMDGKSHSLSSLTLKGGGGPNKTTAKTYGTLIIYSIQLTFYTHITFKLSIMTIRSEDTVFFTLGTGTVKICVTLDREFTSRCTKLYNYPHPVHF